MTAVDFLVEIKFQLTEAILMVYVACAALSCAKYVKHSFY